LTVYQGVVPDGMDEEVKREFDVAYGVRYDEHSCQTTPYATSNSLFSSASIARRLRFTSRSSKKIAIRIEAI
jgi:hypothetical protein